MELTICSKSNFIIWYFKLRLFILTEFRHLRSTALGCKDIGIRNQSLLQKLNSFDKKEEENRNLRVSGLIVWIRSRSLPTGESVSNLEYDCVKLPTGESVSNLEYDCVKLPTGESVSNLEYDFVLNCQPENLTILIRPDINHPEIYPT